MNSAFGRSQAGALMVPPDQHAFEA